MNPKTVIFIVFIAVLATAVCSPSRRFSKDMLLKQFLRELQKKGTINLMDKSTNRKSKREERCDLVTQSCSDPAVAAACISSNTCEERDLGCDAGSNTCGPIDSTQYRRSSSLDYGNN